MKKIGILLSTCSLFVGFYSVYAAEIEQEQTMEETSSIVSSELLDETAITSAERNLEKNKNVNNLLTDNQKEKVLNILKKEGYEDVELNAETISELIYLIAFEKTELSDAIWEAAGMDWTTTPNDGNYIDEYNQDLNWFRSAEKDTFQLADGNTAYFIKNSESKKTAIVSHGYRASSNNMGPWAKIYYDLGYNILTPDATSHGASSGDYINFGWEEKDKYTQWIKLINGKIGQDSSIILHGVSMGAATVLMTSGELDVMDNVDAVVEDSGYTSVADEINYLKGILIAVLGEFIDFDLLPLDQMVEEAVVLLNQKMLSLHGYNLNDMSSKNQLENSGIPTLFIHSSDDSFIPSSFADELYATATSRKSGDMIWKSSGGNHIGAILFDRPGYVDAVKTFLTNLPIDENEEKPESSQETENTTEDSSGGMGTTESNTFEKANDASNSSSQTDTTEQVKNLPKTNETSDNILLTIGLIITGLSLKIITRKKLYI